MRAAAASRVTALSGFAGVIVLLSDGAVFALWHLGRAARRQEESLSAHARAVVSADRIRLRPTT